MNYPDNIPISDVMTTRYQHENKDFSTPLSYDPDGALKLLKEVGWRDTNSDNILDKDGLDFRFTLTVGEANNLMATYIQDNFKRIGVQMEIETMERNIIHQRLKKSDFEAIITRFPNRASSIGNVRNYFGKDSYLNYQNQKMDSIFDRIQNTGDKNKIDSIYNKMGSIFEQDMPVTFLFPWIETHIVAKKIKGLQNNFKADPVFFLEFLSIDK